MTHETIGQWRGITRRITYTSGLLLLLAGASCQSNVEQESAGAISPALVLDVAEQAQGEFVYGCTGSRQVCANDVDECLLGLANCDAHATCTNTLGSYACACNAGYTGNGVTCTDIDECLSNNGGCLAHQTCVNLPGSMSCACSTGYGDCDNNSNTGCEVNLTTSFTDCGACGLGVDDANSCTQDMCVAGVPTHTAVSAGVTCGNSNICDANGSCVSCAPGACALQCGGDFGLPGLRAHPTPYSTTYIPVVQPVAADLNLDGFVDIVLSHGLGYRVFVFLGLGNGRFTAGTMYTIDGLWYGKPVLTDIDGDAYPDLVVGTYPQASSTILAVRRNLGDGTFGPLVQYGGMGTGYPNGPAMADFNGDGAMDVAIGDAHGKLFVRFNQGNGTFGAATTYLPGCDTANLTSGDFNADSKPDLIFWDTTNNQLSVMLNQGNGTFAPRVNFFVGAGVYGEISAADIDGDGDADIAMPFLAANAVVVLRNLGNLILGPPTTYPAHTGAAYTTNHSMNVSDLNGDGKPDLLVEGAKKIAVLINSGTGVFSGPVEYMMSNDDTIPAAADIDGDAKPDLIATYNIKTIMFHRNKGDGTFEIQTELPAGPKPYTILADDFNADGQPDLVNTDASAHRIDIRINQGNGNFPATPTSYPTGQTPFYAATGDVNADSKPDIVVANNGSASVSVLINQGTGTFASAVNYSVSTGAYQIALKDLNGDMLADIAVSTSSNGIEQLMNQGNGTFTMTNSLAAAAYSPIALADVNGDGLADLINGRPTASPDTTAAVLLNQGNGAFGQPMIYQLGARTADVIAADLDGDGAKDLAFIVARYVTPLKASRADPADDHFPQPYWDSHSIMVLRNLANGSGTFAAPVEYEVGLGPTKLTAGDMNRDGMVDLVVSTTDPGTFSVLVNQGNATFAPRVVFPGRPRSIVATDLNGDGADDLATTTESSVGLLFNTCLP